MWVTGKNIVFGVENIKRGGKDNSGATHFHYVQGKIGNMQLLISMSYGWAYLEKTLVTFHSLWMSLVKLRHGLLT